MKRIMILYSMILIVTLFGGISGVSAATGSITSSTTNHSATISRSVTGVSNNVTNTFTYTVTANSNNPSGVTGAPTSATVTFNNVTPSGSTATATGILDFDGTTFTKNGNYYYTVTETSSSNQGTYPKDSSHSYTVGISVRNASETDFSNPKEVVIFYYEGEASVSSKLDPSVLTFSSSASLTTITIGNTVEGTMADVDEYFAVSITINGSSGESYAITGSHKSGDPTSIQSGTPTTVNLKHGDTITISGVQQGATYSFTETNGDRYKTYINGSTADNKSSGNKTVGSTNQNTILNIWNVPTITGIMTRTLPYILIAVSALALTIFIVAKRMISKGSDDNTEE